MSQPGAVLRGVIVADDSSIIRDNVRAVLGEPWRIFLAADGVEALQYARGIKAELVMLDYHMPRLDGVDACALIRNMPHYASVPIVLLTAYDSVDLRRRAGRAGVTAVFSKPFSAQALRAGVLPLIALGRDAAQARLGRDAAQAPLGRDAAQARLGRDAAQARPDRDAALGREASSLPAVLSSQSEAEDDALATGRDVLAVHRRVEAAADPNRYGSFAELMAARRMKSRR